MKVRAVDTYCGEAGDGLMDGRTGAEDRGSV